MTVINKLTVLLGVIILCACSKEDNKKPVMIETEPTIGTGEITVLEQADFVLNAIADRDFSSLANVVHEEVGVLFSPYGHIEKSAQTLMPEEIRGSHNSSEIFDWGTYDAEGSIIQMTYDDYFDKFVYSHDYRTDSESSVNEFLATGNSINNLKERFPNAEFVEFYHPGTEEYANMDWSCLRLVFDELMGETYLVAIVNDRWTS